MDISTIRCYHFDVVFFCEFGSFVLEDRTVKTVTFVEPILQFIVRSLQFEINYNEMIDFQKFVAKKNCCYIHGIAKISEYICSFII